MRIGLKMNELGLYKTLDGKYGLRQTPGGRWAIQTRENPDDPYDWKIYGYEDTFEEALANIKRLIEGRSDEQ
jgi:hypothetical protein